MSVKLPINFKQLDNNITNQELQITIYYNIVVELERLGYVPKLKFKERFTMLEINWTIKADESTLNEMQNKLRQLSS